MKQDAILKMGQGALAHLARQLGLRGAWALEPELLRRALGAYLSMAPPEDAWGPETEPDRVSGDDVRRAPGSNAPGLAVYDLPPAMKTETMARLLETQGKQAEAKTLREGIRRHQQDETAGDEALLGHAPPPADDPSPRGTNAPGFKAVHVQKPSVWVELEVSEPQIRLRWRFGPDGTPSAPGHEEGTWQIELWIWRARGSRITRKVALTEPQGEHVLDRPADAALAAAVLGLRRGGTLRPLARSSLWRAPSLVAPMAPPPHPGGDRSSEPGPAGSP